MHGEHYHCWCKTEIMGLVEAVGVVAKIVCGIELVCD